MNKNTLLHPKYLGREFARIVAERTGKNDLDNYVKAFERIAGCEFPGGPPAGYTEDSDLFKKSINQISAQYILPMVERYLKEQAKREQAID